MRRHCPLGSRRSFRLSCWKYASRCASGISPRSTGLSNEHQKTAQSSSLQPIVFDSVMRKGFMYGVQPTSVEPGTCCKTGEEAFRKQRVPLADKLKQLTRLAQQLLTLWTAELVR